MHVRAWRWLLPFGVVLFGVVVLAACGGESDGGSDPGDTQGDETAAADHAAEHGQKIDRGTRDAGPAKVSLGLCGNVLAGFEAIMDIEVAGMKPEAVRVWVGIESAKGSLKSKLDANDDGVYHGHVDVPTKLPDGSAIWIELQTASNDRHPVSFPIEE